MNQWEDRKLKLPFPDEVSNAISAYARSPYIGDFDNMMAGQAHSQGYKGGFPEPNQPKAQFYQSASHPNYQGTMGRGHKDEFREMRDMRDSGELRNHNMEMQRMDDQMQQEKM